MEHTVLHLSVEYCDRQHIGLCRLATAAIEPAQDHE